MASMMSVAGTPARVLTAVTSAAVSASKMQMARAAAGRKNPPRYLTLRPAALVRRAASAAACCAAAYWSRVTPGRSRNTRKAGTADRGNGVPEVRIAAWPPTAAWLASLRVGGEPEGGWLLGGRVARPAGGCGSRGRRHRGGDDRGDLGPAGAAELGQYPADVCVDGSLGDDQPGGDLPVGQAVGDQFRNLVLPCGQRQPAGGGWFPVAVRGRPERGTDLVAATEQPARLPGRVQRRSELVAGSRAQHVEAVLGVGERLAAGSITQDVDDAQQYGRSRPVTERPAGLGEQASCPEQSPAFWESLKEGKGLTQDFDGFGGIPFPRQAVGKHYLAIAAESAVSRPGENANARDGQELGTGNVARQGD